MKISKKISALLLSLLLIFSINNLSTVSSAQVATNICTPASSAMANLKWSEKFGSSYRDAPSVPTIAGDYLIVMSGDTLYKLNKTDGSIEDCVTMSSTAGFGYIPALYNAGVLYCPLDDSIIEAYDVETMTRLWTYADSTLGQSMTPIVYDNGYIYTGFWYDEETNGNYVCLDAETGEQVWSFSHVGGFYWAGCAINGDYIVFGGDDGTYDYENPSTLFCLNKTTGELTDSVAITGDQRSDVTYDEDTDLYYFTTKAGYLYSVKMTDGKFSNLKSLALGGSSTSTPVVYDGRVYVGVRGSSTSSGYIMAIDCSTMTTVYNAETPGYPQTEVLITDAYDDIIYIYAVCNSSPGGIIVFSEQNGEILTEPYYLFTPESGQTGYSVSRLIVDTDGTLYYKNDSCYVFAVENTFVDTLSDFLVRLVSFTANVIDVIKNIYSSL